MRKLFFALVLLAFCQGRSFAEKQEFAFALPDLEGRISLGVFDSGGKLVRTLYVGATDTDFKIGLNGLIAAWDGQSDSGESVPAGKYTVRGYVVGNGVKTEGVAYHFNDWMVDEASPRITRIRDFQKLPGGFVLAADTVHRVVDAPKGSVVIPRTAILRFDEVRGFVWQNFPNPMTTSSGIPSRLPLRLSDPADGAPRGGDVIRLMGAPPPAPPRIAVTAEFAIASCEGAVRVMKISDGADVHSEVLSGSPALALGASGETAYAAAQDGLTAIPVPHLAPLRAEKTPAVFSSVAVEGKQIIGASETGPGFWQITNGQSAEVPAGIRVTSLSFGVNGTFWATGKLVDSNEDVTGQFDREGAFLRSYRSEFVPRKVDASQEIEEIAVLEEDGGSQRLRVLKLAEGSGTAPREWEIVFEKTVRNCLRFGIADGALTPDAGESAPNAKLTLTLSASGLTASGHALKAQVVSGPDGIWIETGDGLKLIRVAEQKDVCRVAVLADTGKSATVFAGDGAAVAEYLVTGLGEIAEIEAGKIEIP